MYIYIDLVDVYGQFILGEDQPTFDVPTFTIQVNQMYLGKHTMASSEI